MKSSEICDLAAQIVAWRYGVVQYRQNNTTYYPDHSWNLLTWYNDAWHADCLGLVRAVLCGWNADKSVVAGGANTGYACYNYNEIMMLNSCSETSNDFSLLRNHPCSLLYKSGHVGIYIGEFEIDGKRYNSAECTTSFDMGGRPVWVTEDGLRLEYEGGTRSAGYWESWGIFNLNGTDYGITEYDGGGSGTATTGFGPALSQAELEDCWDDIPDYPSYLTYEYLEDLADKLYGIPPNCFEIIAGWTRTEMYPEFDIYMGYLCGCIPLNGYMGHGIHTPQGLAQFVGGTDPVYTPELFHEVCQDLINNPQGYYNELKCLLLVLMNPNQLVRGCSGMDTVPQEDILYQNTINGFLITAWKLPNAEDYTYDITGAGFPGGNPNAPLVPGGKTDKKMPAWMYLRQNYNYTRNRRKNLWY